MSWDYSRCAMVRFEDGIPGRLLIIRYDDGPESCQMSRRWYRVQTDRPIDDILDELGLTLHPRPMGTGVQQRLL
jgi:hypothetical protein